MLDLEQRLDAYLRVVEEEPELTTDERIHLFSLAIWPEDSIDSCVDYAHLMVCRDRYCQECAGTGRRAA